MAFQTATSTSINDLMSQLSTFLQANGWTEDEFTSSLNAGTASFSKNSVFVHFQWDESTDGGVMAIYQSLGFISAGTNKWQHTDDSGSGAPSTNSSNFQGSRCINNAAGPHTSYWFFENDSSPAYVHVVVEVDAGRYRHFGFGEIIKIGDWAGGEYCYGHNWAQNTGAIDNLLDADHDLGLEAFGHNTDGDRHATMHVESWPDEPDANTKWAAFTKFGSNDNDRAGVERLHAHGGWRGGYITRPLSGFRISQFNAFKPLIPVPIVLLNKNSTPDVARLAGYQADCRYVNIGSVSPNAVITIGSDDWYFFPLTRKQNLQNDTEESKNAGVAYRRVDA